MYVFTVAQGKYSFKVIVNENNTALRNKTNLVMYRTGFLFYCPTLYV